MLSREKKECLIAYENYERKYVIKDNVPDAVWEYPIIRPEKPKNYRKIVNYGEKKKKRKFPYYSKDFISKMEGMEETDPDYIAFVKEEWRRRYNGLFFYNGDTLEYVTGRHYCTLQYWKIQATKKINGIPRKGRYQPDFRDNQRDIFYVLDYARKDPKSAGICFIAQRRSGKSNSIFADGYWDTTENIEAVFAVQSKTYSDAQKQFKKIIDSWKLIPHWFKPQDTEETTQMNKLYFGEKKKSGKGIKERVYKDVLNSVIYPENSKEEALDGEYVSYIFQDEAAKSSRGLDINERWNITRECLMDGNIIVGFGVVASTVEDMDKYGSESFKVLWDTSEPKNRFPNGLTESYLYQLFLPAYYGYVGEDSGVSFVDEWGYSNIEASKKYHQKQYDARDGESLMSYQRKYPIRIQDCWVTSDGKNNFSVRRLLEQKIWNESATDINPVKGNFAWRNGLKWGEVDFYPDPQGRWEVAWQPEAIDINRWETTMGAQKKPTRDFCVTGIDPFSHGKVVDEKQGSNGAAVTILKSYSGSEIKEGVVCVYNYRQSDPNAQVEDMIMQCVYYSSPALIESNVSVAVNGFRDKGYFGYVEYNPLETDKRKLGKGLKGYATTSKENVENLISFSASYILDRVGKLNDGSYGFVPFKSLIHQWQNFIPDKRGAFDLVMAAGLAIILARAPRTRTISNFNVEDWMPKLNQQSIERLKPSPEVG